MKIKEKMAELQAKKQELTKKKMNIEISLAEIDGKMGKGNICGICGSERKKPEIIPDHIDVFSSCACKTGKELYDKHCKISESLSSTNNELGQIIGQLDHYSKLGEKLISESNLGRRFKDRKFSNFKKEKFPTAYEKSIEYARGFEENKGSGLLFTGTPGTGKTHLAAAITNYIVEEYGIPVKFGNFTDILDSIKKTFHNGFAGGDKEPEDIIGELSNIPLLVIDDLGKERKTEWSNSILYQVINRRYENYMPVVITTNASMEKLSNDIGEAVLSRIIEMCDGLKMSGKDYRKNRLEGEQ